MRFSFALCLSCLALSAASAWAKGFPYPLQTAVLKNGLRVVVVPFESPGLVAYYTVVRTGSRNEVEPGKTGFAHLFEHIMFRGTKNMPSEERQKLESLLGIHANAWTSDDLTVYHMEAPQSSLEKMIELEGDRFANLQYTKEAFQTETKAVLGEYQKNASHPESKLEEALLDAAFTTHTYRHTTIGFEADVRAMPEQYEHSLEFFKRYYRPDNCIVIIVGPVALSALQTKLEKEYAGWTGKAEPKPIPVEPEPKGEKRAHVTWKDKTLPRLVIAWRGPAGVDPKMAAVQEVLNAYLLSEASPLYKKLVLDDQSVEALGSWYQAHRDPSLWPVLATVKKVEDVAAVEKAILEAVDGVRAGKIDNKFLIDVRDNLRYSRVMNLETVEQVADALLPMHLTGNLDTPGALLDAMAAVDAKALTAFAKKYLSPERRTVVTLATEERK